MLSALSPTIRAATDQDVGARRLAGPVLVAERRGVPLAALSMADGQTVTDPFHPAPAALVALRSAPGRSAPSAGARSCATGSAPACARARPRNRRLAGPSAGPPRAVGAAGPAPRRRRGGPSPGASGGPTYDGPMALETLDEHALGLTWVLDDPLRRTSHALADEGRVWLVDPVDEPEALERAAALGTPQAVLQLLDRHNRDNAAIAARLGVPLLRLPRGRARRALRPLRRPARSRGGRRSRCGGRRAGAWSWPRASARTRSTRSATGRSACTRCCACFPPRVLGGYDPEHLLVGHGEPVHGPEASDGPEGRARAARAATCPGC